jgi:hypothetical protein
MNIRARQAAFVEQARATWQRDPQAARALFESAFEGGPSPEWADAKLERYGLGVAVAEHDAIVHLYDVLEAAEVVVGASAKARAGVLHADAMRGLGREVDFEALRVATEQCRKSGCDGIEDLGHRMLGDHARLEGRRVEAIEHYRVIIAKREAAGNALGCDLRRKIARMLREDGRIDEALAELRRAEEFVATLTVGSGMGSIHRQEYTESIELRTDILVDLALAAGRPDVALAHAEHLAKLAYGVAADLIRRAHARRDALRASLPLGPGTPAEQLDPERVLATPEALVPPEVRLAAEKALLRDPTDVARVVVRLRRAAGPLP